MAKDSKQASAKGGKAKARKAPDVSFNFGANVKRTGRRSRSSSPGLRAKYAGGGS